MPNKLNQNTDNTMNTNTIEFYKDPTDFDGLEEEKRNIIIYSKRIKGKQCTYLPWVPIEVDESVEDIDEETFKIMKSTLENIRKGFIQKVGTGGNLKENKGKITFFDNGWYILIQGSHADKLEDHLKTLGYENIEIKN
jgi:translation initiation factor 1 (eIF-1/SUI1)